MDHVQADEISLSPPHVQHRHFVQRACSCATLIYILCVLENGRCAGVRRHLYGCLPAVRLFTLFSV